MLGSAVASRWLLSIQLMVFLPYQEASERNGGVRYVSSPLPESAYGSHIARL